MQSIWFLYRSQNKKQQQGNLRFLDLTKVVFSHKEFFKQVGKQQIVLLKVHLHFTCKKLAISQKQDYYYCTASLISEKEKSRLQTELGIKKVLKTTGSNPIWLGKKRHCIFPPQTKDTEILMLWLSSRVLISFRSFPSHSAVPVNVYTVHRDSCVTSWKQTKEQKWTRKQSKQKLHTKSKKHPIYLHQVCQTQVLTLLHKYRMKHCS